MTSIRAYLEPPTFDPLAGHLIAEPEKRAPGYWAGAPGAFYDPESGTYYLTYRIRRPRGVEPDRGAEMRIVAGRDGITFPETVFRLEKGTLHSPSIERSALVRLSPERWALYVSYVDPQDGRWRIDTLLAPSPDRFDAQQRKAALTPSQLGNEGVKDPFVFRVGGLWHMVVSLARAVGTPTEEELHGTADAYNTGLIRSATGLAVSEDGEEWEWLGEIFGPRSGQWDGYCARITTVWRRDGYWCAFYDGSASVEQNYEERLGFAYGASLYRFERATRRGPLITVPHASGSVRYVDVLEPGDGSMLVYYEMAAEDGSHELRVLRI